jgi:peptidoglycan/xylan/chitin deacetylase (PgdA/CDA1 family)
MSPEYASATDDVVIPVLLYHSVADVAPFEALRHYTVTPSQFREHVAAIAASGRTPMTVSELAGALKGERPLPLRPVAVTFDDGYDDTPAAVELLRNAGISSTVYVTTGTIATPRGISEALLPALIASALEIGAHTVTHPHLDEIPTSDAAAEIGDSRRELEERLGGPVESFAYPHGAHDRAIRDAVIAAGFTSAAAVKNALSHRGDDPFAIARWTVTSNVSAGAIADVLEGPPPQLVWSGERRRTKVSRSARRMRRRIRSLVAAGPDRHR